MSTLPSPYTNEYGTGHTEAICTTNLMRPNAYRTGRSMVAVMANAIRLALWRFEIGIPNLKRRPRIDGIIGIDVATKWIAWEPAVQLPGRRWLEGDPIA